MGEQGKIIQLNDPVERAIGEKRRCENCLISIQNELKRWNCTIGPVITHTARGVQAGWEIIPLQVPIAVDILKQ